MNSLDRVQIKELKVGEKFKMSMNDREQLTISDIDSEVAYCNHFIGLYVLPLERFVYVVHDNGALPNTSS
ncbi:hypothetical protein [Fulvivirga lutimaris]|uniref:hypothetical protein n=1 Tax=Fulvivirga lutimaris TaxID=1819566 RepID=UPI0012BC10E3|nr:hypothetical protein [Fulvivirga lutimaris]MTI38269.1 hypothetical protein [Fulvivirga lutimaris]